MALYRIADFTIDIKNRYEHTALQCAAYRAPEGSTPDIHLKDNQTPFG